MCCVCVMCVLCLVFPESHPWVHLGLCTFNTWLVSRLICRCYSPPDSWLHRGYWSPSKETPLHPCPQVISPLCLLSLSYESKNALPVHLFTTRFTSTAPTLSLNNPQRLRAELVTSQCCCHCPALAAGPLKQGDVWSRQSRSCPTQEQGRCALCPQPCRLCLGSYFPTASLLLTFSQTLKLWKMKPLTREVDLLSLIHVASSNTLICWLGGRWFLII